MLPNKPLLKEDYQSVSMTIDTIQLRNQENIMLLKGKTSTQLIPRLFPLLDGNHTLEQIYEELSPCPKEIIDKTIEMLCKHYVIEDASLIDECGLSEYELQKYSDVLNFMTLFSERSLPGDQRTNKYMLLKALLDKTCVVYGLGRLGSVVAKLLAESGIGHLILCDDAIVSHVNFMDYDLEEEKKITRAEAMKEYLHKRNEYLDVRVGSSDIKMLKSIDKADIVIMAEDIMVNQRCELLNRICVENNIPWINIKMGELKFQIGPLVVPHETACFECCQNRLNGNILYFDEEQSYIKYKNMEADKVRIFTSDLFINIVSNIAVWEVVKFLSKIYSSVAMGRLLEFDALSMELTSSNILKMPKCRICSKKEKQPLIEPYAVYLP